MTAAGGERPRTSGALLASLAVSALTLLAPHVGPLGPLGAGVLAFLGYRAVRMSNGRVRSRGLAALAMTLALALLVFQGWTMIRHAPTAAAWSAIRARVAEVEEALRTGTAEGAWELLAEDARRDLDREAFVADLREAQGRLGALVAIGSVKAMGGDWNQTQEFETLRKSEFRLPMLFISDFERGRGRIRLEVRVRRFDRLSVVEVTSLRVEPD